MLHQADLGVFKTLIDIVRMIAQSHPNGGRTLAELDRRLSVIKEEARFYKFRVPGNLSSGYFLSQANYAAFEHRSVMQVSPFLYYHEVVIVYLSPCTVFIF